MVELVIPESAAALARIEPYDVILSVGGRQVTTPESLAVAVQASGGKPVGIELVRRGVRTTLEASPRLKRPDGLGGAASWIDQILPYIDQPGVPPGWVEQILPYVEKTELVPGTAEAEWSSFLRYSANVEKAELLPGATQAPRHDDLAEQLRRIEQRLGVMERLMERIAGPAGTGSSAEPKPGEAAKETVRPRE